MKKILLILLLIPMSLFGQWEWVRVGDSIKLTRAGHYMFVGGNRLVSSLEFNLSSGVSDATPPAITDNHNGTINVASCHANIYSTTNYSGFAIRYTIPAATNLGTFDGTGKYLAIDYNSGSPIYAVKTSAQINGSSIVPIYKCWYESATTTLHSIDGDAAGLGLANKISGMMSATHPYQRAGNSGLVLSDSTGRIIKVSSSYVYAGTMGVTVGAYSSSFNLLTFYKHVAGVWTPDQTTTQYNNSQYDNGTSLVSLTGNQWTVNWIYRSIGDVREVFYVLGDQSYSKQSDAELAKPRGDLPTLISQHCLRVGRILVQNGSSTGIVESDWDQAYVGTTVPDINNLTNAPQSNVLYWSVDRYRPHSSMAKGVFFRGGATPNSGDSTLGYNGNFMSYSLAANNGTIAVQGTTTGGYGVYGISTAGNAVYGSATNGNGVIGQATSGRAIYGTSGTGISGLFNNALGSTANIIEGQLDGTQKFAVGYTGRVDAYDYNTLNSIFRLGIGGSFYWTGSTTLFGGGSGTSALNRNTPTSTVPSILINSTNTTTGIGGLSTNISFIKSGVERVRVNDSVKMGDIVGGNYSLTEPDGTHVNIGNATVWDDLMFPFEVGANAGTGYPTFVADSGYYTFVVDTTGISKCIMYFVVQMPHKWKEGSTIYPHVHYKYQTAVGTPNFIVKYKWYNTTGTTVMGWKWCPLTTTTGTTDNTVQMANGGSISGSGKTISSILICQVYLSGTPTNVNAYQFDIHYEIDTEGSRTTTVK